MEFSISGVALLFYYSYLKFCVCVCVTVWVNRPQAYELELLCCYQNILKQNSTEEKRVNKNVLKHIISSSEFSEQ